MLITEHIPTGNKKMSQKEKIRWILAIIFSLVALILFIEILRCGPEWIANNTEKEESPDVFFMFGQLAGTILEFMAIFIGGIVSFSSAALGAFFAYSFKDSTEKFVKLTCRILFISDIFCAIGVSVIVCILLL